MVIPLFSSAYGFVTNLGGYGVPPPAAAPPTHVPPK